MSLNEPVEGVTLILTKTITESKKAAGNQQ
jgi:hypothetical protein